MSKALTLSKTIRSNWDEDVMFYLNNIRGYEVLSPDEEVAVFEKIKNGTEEEKTKARQLIMASNQRFVYSLAKEYAKGKDIMEIVQIATMGMEKAIDKFDVTLGMRFMSYAVWYMRREILQSFNGESQMVRTANKQKLMGALPKIKEKFFQENQRDPQQGRTQGDQHGHDQRVLHIGHGQHLQVFDHLVFPPSWARKRRAMLLCR